MKLFINYIKDKIKSIILALSMIFIFFLVYKLYDINMEAFLYASILSIFTGLIIFIISFLKYKNYIEELNLLKNMENNDEINILNKNDMISREYKKILKSLNEKIYKMELKYKSQIKNQEEFFIMWTHQVKLPITAIRILLDSEENIDKSLIKSQLNRIDQYTKMVLAYIRLNSENSDFVIENVNLDNIIKNVIKNFKSEFIYKNIKLNFKSTNQNIITDKKWFTFVIEQILSNSLKYTDDGSIDIFMENGILKIKDSGIGISKSDLPRIFEKGYTGYNGRNSADSSGLGLYLISNVLKKLHFNIDIDSEVNIGTVVNIDLNQKNHIFE
ncbi:sensor histidine kinase [Helcococcus ovis]|uniref:histidine kinase n=5 Tax=Helcococcus ovis TaxID=72026 RepID=A0A4R9C094_9FIRM|nr:sensor histidine kinase [Helcococcus ovis]TFF63994.1 HAMP domain-containing histidine kinase [Helcococcus ovis]TFF65057.1 HAMP domain-containing histidine kinase [Helcococcus ovis]TFF66817.1 HAMP domain-containing histidine kinase [Helcococcus ovis]WNZ01042.1 sensor histidine kinase [Helcococcus ovis]